MKFLNVIFDVAHLSSADLEVLIGYLDLFGFNSFWEEDKILLGV